MVGRQEHYCPLHFSDHGVEQMPVVDRAPVGQCYLLARSGGPAIYGFVNCDLASGKVCNFQHPFCALAQALGWNSEGQGRARFNGPIAEQNYFDAL